MNPARGFFAHKRVTILGLGLLGRGVGDARFIASCGACVVVTDKKTEEELSASVVALAGVGNVEFHLGGHRREDFTGCDMVIKGAGVRLDSPEIAAAREAGVPVYMSTALAARFAREAGATIVGVTGTRGKSTVAHLIYHALAAAGKRAHLGGNVRGMSTLELLPGIASGDVLVLELDSWQLQGFGDLALSPDVAVFTNLMPDHLNYYPDEEAYFSDKASIFRFQREGDTLIAGPKIVDRIRDTHPPIAPVEPAPLPEIALALEGSHNRENAALAAQALHALGLTEDEIRKGLESFVPVEGRLQFLREVRGVKIYNDNNATTPEATIAAIDSFPPGKVVLICGGADKGLEVKALASLIGTRCKSAYLLSGTGTEKLQQHLIAPVFDSIDAALKAALDASVAGDVLLFSPGFASFGMFRNEYDRNDAFVAAAGTL